MRNALIALVVLAVVGIVEGIYFTVIYLGETRREELKRRLQSLGGAPGMGISLLRAGKLSNLPTLDSLLRAFSPAERLEALIVQADLPITVARLLSFSIVGALAGLTLTLATKINTAVAPLLMLFLAALPLFYVMHVRTRRNNKISQQLPDALDMMARSLRAGHALNSSFRLVASEMPEPISMEFGRAFEEQNLGLSLERAVENMTLRLPLNRDLKIFAVSVIIQKETGGNLAEILEKIGETIRGRYRFYGKLQALTGEARVSGYILGGLPIVTGLLLWALRPDYMSQLVTDPIGRGFFIYGVVTWTVGFMWMRYMAKVEF
jgi:tight adherence protein B